MFELATAGGNPSAVTTAVIALAGAVIGGLLTAGTQLLIERSRSNRQDAARKVELRTAARMMAVDLARARSNIELAARTGNWWEWPGLSSRISATDHRLVIGELTPVGFYKIDRAEAAVDYWYGFRDRLFPESSKVPDLEPKNILSQVVEWIDEATEELRKITGDPESVRSIIGRDGTVAASR